MKGTVKWYNARKGYGFIQCEDGSDVFVHRSSISPGVFLNEGDDLEFDLEETDRGPKAVNVRKL